MRIYILAALGLVSVAAASATSIQLGGANGLTSNYIVQGAGAVCAAGTGNCVTGSTAGGDWFEASYNTRLFASATEGGSTPAVPTGSLDAFSLINDGTGKNFWDGGGASTLIVPVGVNNVWDVQTLMNNVWGLSATQDTTVTFNFGATSNASIFDYIVTVNLMNSSYLGANSGSGQISTGVHCTSPTLACGDVVPNGPWAGYGAYANGPVVGSSVVDGVTVTTQVKFSTPYDAISPSSDFYLDSSFPQAGNLTLTSQTFNLASIVAPSVNEYLVSVKITENDGAADSSQTALSAITVDQAPEPASVFLFLSGLGALGYARLRRKA